MLKKGFFTIELLIALALFCLAANLLFSYIGRIQIMKATAQQLYDMTNLATSSLEQKRPIQQRGFQTTLHTAPMPNSKLQKITATVKCPKDDKQITIWTLS